MHSLVAHNNPQSRNNTKFGDARRKEVDGLMSRGVFNIAEKKEAIGPQIYGSRVIETLKEEGTPEVFEKSPLVVQGLNDNAGLLTHAMTAQRPSQRPLMDLCAYDADLTLFIRDVSQAYVQ